VSIHVDFPDLPEKGTRSWDMPVPLDDIQTALEQGGGRADLWDVAEVTEYAIDYHGTPWSPGSGGGSELGLVLVARLKDGRWLGLEAWNDYTGWGCQDGSDLYIGPTREDVIANGITNDGRSALGLELA
jgi:hypothetical protein